MEEMMNNEEMTMNETTDVMPAEETVEETSNGGSMLVKLAIIGVCGAVAGAAAFGAKKLKQKNRQRTIEKLREEGWTVEEPASEVVDSEEVIPEEEAPEEE